MHPNWVRLAPNGTNLGLFKISFSTFWLDEPKCTETYLKKSQICTIWGKSASIWIPNVTSLLSGDSHQQEQSCIFYRPLLTLARQIRASGVHSLPFHALGFYRIFSMLDFGCLSFMGVPSLSVTRPWV